MSELMQAPVLKLPCGCDDTGNPVFWNPLNKVVQCHKCGTVYDVLNTPPPMDGKPPDGGNRKGVDKVKMGLVMHDMAEALYEVCKVMTFGAEKHEPKGWIKVPNGTYEYTEALNRHINAESRGELRDKEWNLLHAAHAACCALIRCQLIINEQKSNQALPEGTTFENGFAMVPNTGVKFVVQGGLPENGALTDFTPIDPDPSKPTGVAPFELKGPKPYPPGMVRIRHWTEEYPRKEFYGAWAFPKGAHNSLPLTSELLPGVFEVADVVEAQEHRANAAGADTFEVYLKGYPGGRSPALAFRIELTVPGWKTGGYAPDVMSIQDIKRFHVGDPKEPAMWLAKKTAELLLNPKKEGGEN